MMIRGQLTDNAVEFYTALFRSRERPGKVSKSRWFPKVLTEEMNTRLARLLLEDEIHKVVMSLSPDKAPRPDGSFKGVGL